MNLHLKIYFINTTVYIYNNKHILVTHLGFVIWSIPGPTDDEKYVREKQILQSEIFHFTRSILFTFRISPPLK